MVDASRYVPINIYASEQALLYGGSPMFMDTELKTFVTFDNGNPVIINELFSDLIGGPTNLNPWAAVNSSSRQQMQASHLKQSLVIKGCSRRRNVTGTEREYGKYTFNARIPVDATILKIIPKYAKQYSLGAIKKNPGNLIIYEDFHTKQISSIYVEDYFFHHTTLGWKYDFKPVLTNLQTKQNVRAGTILADSPSVDENGAWNYGLETNVAFMTVPSIIEDGFVISESYRQKLATTMLGVRTASCGSKYFPLNLYGDMKTYKPFPGPGDKIRDDGLVLALRKIDENMSISDMHPRNLLGDRVNVEFDITKHGQPGAVVVDADVLVDHNARFRTTPTGMYDEMEKYTKNKDIFYKTILETYDHYFRRNRNLDVHPDFHGWVVEALANFSDSSPDKVTRNKNKIPLDDFRIEVKYAFTKIPNIGYKVTDTHGTKGVIVAIWPDEHMPMTQCGIRADVIKDPLSVIKRSNVGQIFEQWTNQASTQCARRVRKEKDLDEAYRILMDYYSAASPFMYYHCLEKHDTVARRHDHVRSVQDPNLTEQEAITLLLPANSPNVGIQQVIDIENNVESIVGPVTYTGLSGKRITTKKNVTIDSKYMMLLDKTGEDWSCTSIAKRQHHGIVVQLSKADKHLNPYRDSPVRFAGESEVRLMVSVMDPDAVAELLDRTNSVYSSEAVNWSIINADKPTDIDCAVDRKKVPRGSSRPLQMMKHIIGCGGIEFVYEPYKPELRHRSVA